MFTSRDWSVLIVFFAVMSAGTSAQTVADPEVTRLDPFVTSEQKEALDAATQGGISGLPGGTGQLPRSSIRIGRELIDTLRVARMEDLAPLIAGASSAPPYGLTGVPMLRGDLGDAAQNGQRRAYNRNVFPVSFNALESVEVLAGAPPVFLGYTHGTGGFANLLTKQPDFARSGGQATLSLGTWDDWRWQLDFNQSWSPRLAGRLSMERIDSGSFYRLVEEASTDLYLALAWRPATTTQWNLSVESYDGRFAENPGTNRPTQALIDRGEYLIGSSVQNGGTGSYFGNTFVPTGTVRIDGSQVLVAPGDTATARNLTAQLTGTWRFAGARLVNRTYFERVEAEKYAAYHFYSYVPQSLTLENRLEVQQPIEGGRWKHGLLYGAALRGEKRESYVDFLNEAMNAFDVTMAPETLRLPVSSLRFVQAVPGRPGRYAVPGGRYGSPASVGISQTLRSRLVDAGVFVQDHLELSPAWSLLLGARGDWLAVRAEDPLPRAGYAARQDHRSQFLPAATASVIWQPAKGVSFYITAQQARAVESSSSSGGFGLTGNTLPGVLFENGSRLCEFGAKGAADEGRFSWRTSVYDQQRQRTNPRFGLPDEIRARGVEISTAWSPAPHVSVTANGAYQDIRYRNGPLPGGIATVPSFDPARPSDNFGSSVSGDYRVPGLPRWLLNVQAGYLPPTGLGARVWMNLQGAQNLDLFGNVRIPAQQTWNAGLVYRVREWEISVDGLNLTDEFNWRPTSTPFAGGDLVTRELPRRWRTTVRYRF